MYSTLEERAQIGGHTHFQLTFWQGRFPHPRGRVNRGRSFAWVF